MRRPRGVMSPAARSRCAPTGSVRTPGRARAAGAKGSAERARGERSRDARPRRKLYLHQGVISAPNRVQTPLFYVFFSCPPSSFLTTSILKDRRELTAFILCSDYTAPSALLPDRPVGRNQRRVEVGARLYLGVFVPFSLLSRRAWKELRKHQDCLAVLFS